MIKPASISIAVACAFVSVLAAGCCNKSKCQEGRVSVEEAIDIVLAATTNSLSYCDSEFDDACPAAVECPSVEEARTNLAVRLTFELRATAAKMAALTDRREKALSDALENDTDLASAYREMVEARKRYDDLVGSMQSLQEIDAELVNLRRMRGALLKRRAEFIEKAISKSTSKKESK